MNTNTSNTLTKTCTKCSETKTIECFSNKSRAKDGKCSQCKSCMKIINDTWYKNNKDKRKITAAERYKSNPEKYKNSAAKWQRENPEKFKEYQSRWNEENSEYRREYLANWHQENSERRLLAVSLWQKANRGKVNAKGAAYRARKLKATPPWSDEFNDLVMAEAYDLAQRREVATGLPWEVDHIIPLQGKTVCGLHIWNNVQVIPEKINQSKSNRINFDYYSEWLNEINKFN